MQHTNYSSNDVYAHCKKYPNPQNSNIFINISLIGALHSKPNARIPPQIFQSPAFISTGRGESHELNNESIICTQRCGGSRVIY